MLNAATPMLDGMSPGQEMCTASGAGLCAYRDPLCLWETLSHVSDLPGKLLVSLEDGGESTSLISKSCGRIVTLNREQNQTYSEPGMLL